MAASCGQRGNDNGVVYANNDSLKKSNIGKILKITYSGITEDSVMNHIASTKKKLVHFRKFVDGGKQTSQFFVFIKKLAPNKKTPTAKNQSDLI